ncbi:MAG: hypothetical protein KY461_02570 [Actinobacteria bacterium]|nr:hypothetical protein [Actinomycetota bacterium]
MATAPYAAGDRLELVFDGVHRSVVVGAIVGIPAPDPHRRWRLLCRDEVTGASIDLPVYCGDDGRGELIQPAEETAPGVAPAP